MRAGRARADDPLPLVHPLYVHLPDAPEDDALRRAFTAAAARYRLRPVEVVDVPAPPAPRAPEWLQAGVLNTQKIAFGEALHDLDAAAAEVSTTGGAGLSTDELSDLYLNRAIATAHADWNATADAPPTEARTRGLRGLPPRRDAGAGADAEHARDAAAGARRLRARGRRDPPAAARLADRLGLRRRAGRAGRRPADAGRGRLVLRDLVAGEHLIRVEELGHAGWGAVVAFNPPTQDVAFRRARRWGWTARPPRRTPAGWARGSRWCWNRRAARTPRSALRLIDTSGQERDAVVLPPADEAGTLDAAVMRLDEAARRLVQAEAQAGTPPPPAATATPVRSRRPS